MVTTLEDLRPKYLAATSPLIKSESRRRIDIAVVCDALRCSGRTRATFIDSAHMADARDPRHLSTTPCQNTNVDRRWNRGKYLSRKRGIPRSQQPLANVHYADVPHHLKRYIT